MATIQDIQVYSALVIKNNKSGLISKLNEKKYNVPLNVTNLTLQHITMAIYEKNPSEFFSILTSVPYNPSANNFTTDPSFHKQLQNLINK